MAKNAIESGVATVGLPSTLVAGKTANAGTAVKAADATARHCVVMHGQSTFLSGEERNLDHDQECFTRANVAHCGRATNLTILACPLNMQGMPRALQVLAALLHGVQTMHTNDDRELAIQALTPCLSHSVAFAKSGTGLQDGPSLPGCTWAGSRVCFGCLANAGMASHTRRTAGERKVARNQA